MTTARNPVTGDALQTRPTSQQYRDNWDKIFGKPEKDVKLEKAQETKQDKAEDIRK